MIPMPSNSEIVFYQLLTNANLTNEAFTLSETNDIIASKARTRSGNVGLFSAASFQQLSMSWYLGQKH